MKALDLLRSSSVVPQGLAIVVDEHGGTEGVVTLSDIVEEIISDAVPTTERELYIEAIGEGRLIVNGNARLDDISELLVLDLEEDGIDTIGGLIFNRLGTLPNPAHSCTWTRFSARSAARRESGSKRCSSKGRQSRS